MDEGVSRLAAAMKARRAQLGISQRQVADVSGGPGLGTVKMIERGGTGGGVLPATALAVDRALRWAPGSASDVLAGGTPSPSDTDGWPTRSGDWAEYVAQAERGDEESFRDFVDATDHQTEPADPLTAASDAQLIAQLGRLNAELARRLAERRP